jgi:hypothetical protein
MVSVMPSRSSRSCSGSMLLELLLRSDHLGQQGIACALAQLSDDILVELLDLEQFDSGT